MFSCCAARRLEPEGIFNSVVVVVDDLTAVSIITDGDTCNSIGPDLVLVHLLVPFPFLQLLRVPCFELRLGQR